MKTKMMAVVATLALFAIAGTFVVSSVAPMTIPVNDPHGLPAGGVYTIPVNDPHFVTDVLNAIAGITTYVIPVNDPHCIGSLVDELVFTIPVNDPH
jgi:fructose 1,6-bisphosphatase